MTTATASSTTSWRPHSTSIGRRAARSGDWPAICAEDLHPVGDPLEIAIARAATISQAVALQLLGETSGPLAAATAPWLFPHQRDAASRLSTLLDRWGGAVLADATGLGKTYIALGVAAAREEDVTVIAPAALRDQWLDAARRTAVPIRFASTESLSRGGEPGCSRLAVVDEAHHFRNPHTRRYGVLARWLVRRRALLLTATPVVNRVADAVALLRLFLPDDALRAAGIASLGDLEHRPALVRKAWHAVAVARDARETRMADCLPRRRVAPPFALPPVSPSRLTTLIGLIDALETPGADEPRALLRLLLFRALTSSAVALRASAQHHARFVERTMEAARQGLALPRRAFRKLVAAGDPDQLGFLPLLLEAAVIPTDIHALERDLERLGHLAALVDLQDPKAQTLHDLLQARVSVGRAVVFVNAVATARYLATRLPGAVALTSAGGWTRAGYIATRDALRPFQPRGQPPPRLDARVLVATDVAGEGLDLQGASLVVHYDLPWTPARLAQRMGRVQRLGSPHRVVDERAFIPARPLAERLRLVTRLLEKERIGGAVNRLVASPSAALIRGTSRVRFDQGPVQGPPALAYRIEVRGYWVADGLPAVPADRAARRLRALLRAATRHVEPPGAVRLARRVLLRAASRASKERSRSLMERLDRAVGRLTGGLSAGELLLLEDAISSPGRLRRILEWSDRVRERPTGSPSIEVFLVSPPGEPLP